MDTVTLSDDEVAALLAKQESHFLDHKDIRVAPSKLTQSLSAFCNAEGGDLYVGVTESAGAFAWNGFVDIEDANAHLATFEQVSPLGEDLDATFLASNSHPGLVLHINARKSRQVRPSSDGTVYKRLGAQNIKIAAGSEAMTRLRRTKGIESFESETVDVDLDLITNSIPVLQYLLDVIPTADRLGGGLEGTTGASGPGGPRSGAGSVEADCPGPGVERRPP